MSIRFSSKTLKSVAPIFDRYLMKDKSILKKDKIRLFIKAGRGGNGLYRYNGIGGNGGNIYITGQSNLNFDSFYDRMVLKTHLHAENGQDSTCSKLIGTHGRDLIVRVPVGVEAMNVETKSVIAKCLTTRSKTVIARGGIGGCSKNSFRGSPGEAFFIEFYLKIISNVALFGLPNAGKSSLMKALIPKRKIKIASYPFTTRKPQLCVMKVDEDFESSESPFNISVSDLPGLLCGKSDDPSGSDSVLKHLENADILLMVVDSSGFQLSPSISDEFRSALDTVALLNVALEKYSVKLTRKPCVLAINKVDLPNGEEVASNLIKILKRSDWFNEVDASIRPSHPLLFDSLIPTVASQGKIANLKETLKRIYAEIRSHSKNQP